MCRDGAGGNKSSSVTLRGECDLLGEHNTDVVYESEVVGNTVCTYTILAVEIVRSQRRKKIAAYLYVTSRDHSVCQTAITNGV